MDPAVPRASGIELEGPPLKVSEPLQGFAAAADAQIVAVATPAHRA